MKATIVDICGEENFVAFVAVNALLFIVGISAVVSSVAQS